MRQRQAIGDSAWRWVVAWIFLTAGPWTGMGQTTNDAATLLKEWQQFYGVPDESLARDDDQDALNGRDEETKLTDPFRFDTDHDGVSDKEDFVISRAYLPISDPQFLWVEDAPFGWSGVPSGVQVEYAIPADWFKGAVLVGGSWLREPVVCWQGATNGGLCLMLDRSRVTGDVIVQLALAATDQAGLRVDLLDDAGGERAHNVSVKATVERSDNADVMVATIQIPLAQWPKEATVIAFRPTGDNNLWLLEGLVYRADETATINAPSSTNSTQSAASSAASDSSGDNARSMRSSASGQKKFDAGQTEGSGNRVAVTTSGKGLTVSQLMASSLRFKMPRSAVSSSGKRQNSLRFAMEDTIGQASPIGWMNSPKFRLHSGYQQAEETICRTSQIWNVSVLPSQRFAPEHVETATFSYVLSYPAEWVTVEMLYNGNTIPLITTQPQVEGLHTVQWNGRDGGGVLAATATWTNRVRAASCSVVKTSEVAITIQQNLPVIMDFNDSPDPTCQSGGNMTRINYELVPQGGNDDVRVQLFDLDGSQITTVMSNDVTARWHYVDWDGTAATNFAGGGTAVPDGVYYYSIQGRNGGNPNNWNTGGVKGNAVTGVVVRACQNDGTAVSGDGQVTVLYQQTNYSVSVAATGGSTPVGALQLMTTNRISQSAVYQVTITPGGTLTPPAVVLFNYDPVIAGPFGDKLKLKRFDGTDWVDAGPQIVDYKNNRVVAKVSAF